MAGRASPDAIPLRPSEPQLHTTEREETEMSMPAIHAAVGEDSPRARRSDPHTSHEAADLNNVDASIGAVLDTLTQYGPHTDERLHELMLGLGHNYSPSRVRTARAALRDLGRVIDTGQLEKTHYGRNTIVWAAA